MKITILDYGAGNLINITTFLNDHCGYLSEVVKAADLKPENIQCLVIPGVGHFGDASKILKETSAIDKIHDICKEGKPIIGICLGAQLLLRGSEEAEVKDSGIGLINGECIYVGKIKTYDGKIPRIGWSEIEKNKGTYYFVHSYCMMPKEKDRYIIERCKDDKIVASIRFDNVLAVQFHPEKSGDNGKTLFKSFIEEYA